MGNRIGQPDRTGWNLTALLVAVAVAVVLGAPLWFLLLAVLGGQS